MVDVGQYLRVWLSDYILNRDLENGKRRKGGKIHVKIARLELKPIVIQ